jgi:predicted nucleic acid-binding protein
LIFVDTNILIDVAIGNPAWADWSHQALASARARGPLLINAIVYAEFAIGFEAQSDCDAEIEKFDLAVAQMPVSAPSVRRRLSGYTGAAAESARARYPTSLSERMPASRRRHCSRATCGAIAPIFQS